MCRHRDIQEKGDKVWVLEKIRNLKEISKESALQVAERK